MENRIRKLYLQDLIIILYFLAFLWLTLVYIIISVINTIDTVPAKTAILIIGLLVGLFASLTLLALFKHLRKNKRKVYLEEIENSK